MTEPQQNVDAEKEAYVVPWESLSGNSVASLRKLADMLSAVSNTGKPVFGKAGVSISNELKAFCDVEEKEKKISPTPRKKTTHRKRKADERYGDAREVVECFMQVSQEEIGALPPDFNWGRAIKKLYQAFDAHWDKLDIKELIPIFFDTRHSAPWIYKNGSFVQMIDALARLQVVREQTNEQKQSDVIIPKEFLSTETG